MTIAPPSTDPGADAGPPRSPAPRRSDGFFAWIAGLGVVRTDGWIAGVAGGVAAHLRIDPLIVRGVLVVATLFGLPMLFVYAIAWALLPDADGRIHVRNALRGRFDPALLGIAGTIALGFVPAASALVLGLPWIWGSPLSDGWSAIALLASLLGLLVIAGLVFLIVRAARRTPGSPDLRQASAASGAPVPPVAGSGPATAEVDAVGRAAASTTTSGWRAPATDAAEPHADDPGLHDATEPPAPPADSPEDDLEAWRAQHAAWKQQEQDWRRRQQDADRLAREKARAERREQSAAFAAAAAEHRRDRRLLRPRTSAAFVAVIIGVAIVAGAITALLGAHGLALAVGLFTAALIVAIGMVVAGLARRRSGFLAFMTVLLLAGGATATVVPVAQSLHAWGYGFSNTHGGGAYPAQAPFVQPWGDLWLHVGDTGTDGEWHIRKRNGVTQIAVEPGAEIALEVTTRDVGLSLVLAGQEYEYRYLPEEPGITVTRLSDGRTRYAGTLRRDDDVPVTTRQRIVIEQDSGYFEVSLWERDKETEQAGGRAGLEPTPTPIPSAYPDPEGGAVDG